MQNVGVVRMQSLMRSDLQQADEAGERGQSTGSSGKSGDLTRVGLMKNYGCASTAEVTLVRTHTVLEEEEESGRARHLRGGQTQEAGLMVRRR